MADINRYISYISVEKREMCECRRRLLHRDMNFICNTGDYAEEGTWEEVCTRPQDQFRCIEASDEQKERIERSILLAVKANGIEPSSFECIETIVKLCAQCNGKVMISFYPTVEYVEEEHFISRKEVKENLFKTDPAICSKCYQNDTKPAKC